MSESRLVLPSDGPHDAWAYRIAVASVGLALVAFLIGVSVVLASGKMVPQQLWDAGSAIAGALLGNLVPEPTKPPPAPALATLPRGLAARTVASAQRGTSSLWHALSANRSVVLLMAIFGVTAGFGIADNVSLLQQLASASGGALIGQLAPSPGKTT